MHHIAVATDHTSYSAELNPKAPCIKLTTNSEVNVAPKPRHSHPSTKVEPASTPLDSTLISSPITACLRYLPSHLFPSLDPSDLYCVLVSPVDVVSHPWLARARFVRLVRLSLHASKEEGEKQDRDEAAAVAGNVAHARVRVAPAIPSGHVVFGEGVQETLEAEAFAVIKWVGTGVGFVLA